MILRRLILVLLSFLCLTADAGITVYQSRCIQSGNIRYGLQSANPCCKPSVQKHTETQCSWTKKSCCEIQTIRFKSSLIATPNPPGNQQALPALQTFFILGLSDILMFQQEPRVSVYPPNPPPVSVRPNLLLTTRCFRI